MSTRGDGRQLTAAGLAGEILVLAGLLLSAPREFVARDARAERGELFRSLRLKERGLATKPEIATCSVRTTGSTRCRITEKAALRWLDRYLVEGAPRLPHFVEITASLAKRVPEAG